MNRGNTLVYMLLGLAIMALVGLCFAPYQYRPCGHRSSLMNEWFPEWRRHICYGNSVRLSLYEKHRWVRDYQRQHGQVAEKLSDMQPAQKSPKPKDVLNPFTLDYRAQNHDWQIGVSKMDTLPGWYLLTSDGKVHFNEKGPAQVSDRVLLGFPTP